VAAQLIPLVGAASGAAINHIFIEHFQNVARGHFTIRRLERTYGAQMVEEAYRGAKAKPVEHWEAGGNGEGHGAQA
jgi:hypothetical protein